MNRSLKPPRTIDVQVRLREAGRRAPPRTPDEALARLRRGNRRFASILDRTDPGLRRVILLDPESLGFGAAAGQPPVQHPFAAVLGCADARAPVEMVFQQRANDLFVVRVAGNGVGSGSLGSLRYAAAHFDSLRLIAVLGHSGCGAVSAAVDAFLKPRTYLPLAANYPLRSIVDAILVAVRSAALGLETAHGPGAVALRGYRAALVETAVVINACLAAFALQQEMEGPRTRVVFGRYDLATRVVGLPAPAAGPSRRAVAGLVPCPGTPDELGAFCLRVARSAPIAALLRGPAEGS